MCRQYAAFRYVLGKVAIVGLASHAGVNYGGAERCLALVFQFAADASDTIPRYFSCFRSEPMASHISLVGMDTEQAIAKYAVFLRGRC